MPWAIAERTASSTSFSATADSVTTGVDLLRSPGGDLRVNREDQRHRRALPLGPRDGDIHRPGELLAGLRGALGFENDREDDALRLVEQFENQVHAELDRDQLVEGRVRHAGGCVPWDLEVEEKRQKVCSERRVLAEHVDETIVLQRRHGRHANTCDAELPSFECVWATIIVVVDRAEINDVE